ncbi:hypothetical protein CRUP_008149 [Coryphaenoides rupestris]|nr:hypothetical protein CRUP_008149 [Coryphaenoides rupestris]
MSAAVKVLCFSRNLLFAQGLVLSFYLVFYLFLAGMFVFTMYVMLLTLDEFTPTIQERLRTPGLMIRPTGDQLELRFSPENPETWSHYVRSLDAFLERLEEDQGDEGPQAQDEAIWRVPVPLLGFLGNQTQG